MSGNSDRLAKRTLVTHPNTCLTGFLQETVDTLAPEEATQYDAVKNAILHTLSLTYEAYRKRFRELRLKQGQNPRPLARRMQANALQWLKLEERTKDQLVDLVVMEQLLMTLNLAPKS